MYDATFDANKLECLHRTTRRVGQPRVEWVEQTTALWWKENKRYLPSHLQQEQLNLSIPEHAETLRTIATAHARERQEYKCSYDALADPLSDSASSDSEDRTIDEIKAEIRDSVTGSQYSTKSLSPWKTPPTQNTVSLTAYKTATNGLNPPDDH